MANNSLARQYLVVTIRNREKILMQGLYKAVTCSNEKGVFDVLPQHANFISIVDKFITIHKIDGSKQEMKINQGVLRVYQNNAFFYLDILPSSSTTGRILPSAQSSASPQQQK